MNEWRPKERFFSHWPKPFRVVLGHIWPEHISWEELINEMDRALQIPGNVNAWTMPIKGRIDMLTTGVRTPIGIKIFGADLDEIQRIGEQIESILRNVPGTRSIFAERAAGGYFVDFVPKREVLARYGLTIDDLQDVIMTAIGGENISTTIEGRERYTINLRYPRDLRRDLDQLQRVLVTAALGHGHRRRRHERGVEQQRRGRHSSPDRRVGGHQTGQRPVDDPRRERHARRLCLCGHRRPRRRRLRGRCQEAVVARK